MQKSIYRKTKALNLKHQSSNSLLNSPIPPPIPWHKHKQKSIAYLIRTKLITKISQTTIKMAEKGQD